MTDLLQPLAKLQEPVQIVGDRVEARLLDPGGPVDRRSGTTADRDGDPALGTPFLPVQLRQLEPAAVFRAQILGEVRKVVDL